MGVAIDWCSHTTNDWIWLVSCLGFNGPLRQFFSLYRAVCQRGGKKRQTREKKCPNNHPHYRPLPFSVLSKLVARLGTESLPSTIAPADQPLSICENNKQSGSTSVSRKLKKKTTLCHKLEKQKLKRKEKERKEEK